MKKGLLTYMALSLPAALFAQSQSEASSQGPVAPEQQQQQQQQGAETLDTAELQQKMQEIGRELQEISQRLQTAQQAARDSSEVQEAISEYTSTLEKEMIEIAPSEEETIARKNELLQELLAVNEPQSLEPEEQQEYQQKVGEYQQLQQGLAQVEQQAVQDEAVQETQQAAQQAQLEKMKEVEPELMELVQLRNELSQQLAALRMQIQQGQQQGAPPRPGQQPTPQPGSDS